MTTAERPAVTLSGRTSRRMGPVKVVTKAKGTMMGRQGFFTIAAGISLVTGAAALLVPAAMASVFGVTLDEVGASQTRLLGSAYLGYALVVWFARDVRDITAQRAIALGNCVSWTLSTGVIAVAIVAGHAGPQAWSLVVVGATFAAAWGYFSFVEGTEVAPA